MIEALLMHPISRAVHRCRVRVSRDGLSMCRVSGDAEAETEGGGRSVESDPIVVGWRSLRGFSADESHVTPAGRRLQVLEIDTDDGVLTVFAPAAEVSVLFGAVRHWAERWRLARSPLGVVFGGRRKRLAREVA